MKNKILHEHISMFSREIRELRNLIKNSDKHIDKLRTQIDFLEVQLKHPPKYKLGEIINFSGKPIVITHFNYMHDCENPHTYNAPLYYYSGLCVDDGVEYFQMKETEINP